MTAFTLMKYWCSKCLVGYNNSYDHACSVEEKKCHLCCTSGCDIIARVSTLCETCNITFKNETCYKNNIQMCDKKYRCTSCYHIYKAGVKAPTKSSDLLDRNGDKATHAVLSIVKIVGLTTMLSIISVIFNRLY